MHGATMTINIITNNNDNTNDSNNSNNSDDNNDDDSNNSNNNAEETTGARGRWNRKSISAIRIVREVCRVTSAPRACIYIYIY